MGCCCSSAVPMPALVNYGGVFFDLFLFLVLILFGLGEVVNLFGLMGLDFFFVYEAVSELL